MTITVTKEATPSTPATNDGRIFLDSADGRIKFVDEKGSTNNMTSSESMRNIIINGGFAVQQKVATASTAIANVSTTTRAGVVADRWSVTTSVASNLNWQQVDTASAPETGLDSRFYGSMICSTAGKKVMISQWIINREMAHVRGKQVRLQCKIKQTVGSAKTMKLGLLYLTASGTVDTSPAFLTGAWSTTTGVDPTWGTNLVAITPEANVSGENGTITGDYLNITTTANWVRSSCVFTVPSTAKNLMVVLFDNATGGTTDNTSVAEFSLNQGEEINDWVEQPFQLNLLRCQPYYCKSFPVTTVPAQNTGSGGIYAIAGKAGATALGGNIGIIFPVPMIATPTVTLYCPTEASAQVDRLTGTTPIAHTASATNDITSIGLYVTSTGTANTAVGDVIAVHYSASAEIVA